MTKETSNIPQNLNNYNLFNFQCNLHLPDGSFLTCSDTVFQQHFILIYSVPMYLKVKVAVFIVYHHMTCSADSLPPGDWDSCYNGIPLSFFRPPIKEATKLLLHNFRFSLPGKWSLQVGFEPVSVLEYKAN